MEPIGGIVLFHRTMAALVAMIAAASMAALLPRTASAVERAGAAGGVGNLTVNLTSGTGAVLGGADGALYGLSENGVPGADAFNALHIKTIDVAPPGAQQHPTGHADQVDSEFFSAAAGGSGGKTMLVYMQDIYSAWLYQNLGLSDYLPKVEAIVRELSASPYAAHIAYIPFNEPDWIWYGLNTSSASQYVINRDKFLADWTTVYQAIRSIDPSARIVGPNEAYYDSRFMPDFLSYAKAHNVLPQVISWHELSPSSLQTFSSSVAAFRTLEASDGISRLPVDIDEYANRYNLSVPGEMVQWLSMFENAKVYADMPYWDIADNYSDTVVRNDEPNGQWWLLYWYGQLTGHTVSVAPPSPLAIDTLQGLAALDTAKRQARVLVADPSGGSDSVTITGISPAVFGSSVHVSVRSAGWSGYDGSAYTPLDVAETSYPVVNGSVTVPLGTTDPMSAYQMVVTPATRAAVTAPTSPGTQTYLAADASLTDATVYSQGSVSNANGYATAGGKDVGSIDQTDSRVTFTVTAPHSGRYLMKVFYGNQTGTIAQQIQRVDSGAWSFVNYPPTLNWLFRSHQDLYLQLGAGTHTITFGVSDPSIGTATGQVTLDDIQLTAVPANHGAAGSVAGVTGPGSSYPAAYADLSGRASTLPCDSAGCAAPQSVVLGGGSVSFAVDAGADGFYAIRPVGAAGNGTLTVDGVAVSPGVVYLHAGINPVRYSGTGVIGGLKVTPTSGTATTYAAATSQNILSGTAVVAADQYAYGGKYVGYIGNGAANTLTFTGVTVPRSGTYRVMVSYADNDRAGSGNYNSNLIDRGLTVTTSAGTSVTAYARNTYSWDQFDTVEVTVTLNAGTNTITIGNSSYYAPNIDKIIVAPASGS
jgi:hypothetical protein